MFKSYSILTFETVDDWWLLLPPGRDASPSQGYPQQYVASTHLYTWVKTDKVG